MITKSMGGKDENVIKLEYAYVARISGLAGNAQQDLPALQISEDADFIITEVSRTRKGTFKLQIHDSSRDRFWSNDLLDDDNFFGNIGSNQSLLPRQLPRPIRVSKNSTLKITVKDTSGSSNDIEVALHGYKEYPKS